LIEKIQTKNLNKNVSFNVISLNSRKKCLNKINVRDIDINLFDSMKSEIKHFKWKNEKLFTKILIIQFKSLFKPNQRTLIKENTQISSNICQLAK
jgi:hypothetical protein